MSGGGGSGSDGSDDMQVSGAEAAYSTEKGISTHADTRVQHDSFTRHSDTSSGDSSDNTPVYQANYADQDLETQREMDARLGADTSTVGIAAPDTNYSDSEIEKGYTDDGQKLTNVNGKYMTKQQMYNTGIIEKDPETGQDVEGRNTINPNTGEIERADLTWKEHWDNRPDSIKWSPTLSFLYATGKNIGEWTAKKGWGSATGTNIHEHGGGDGTSESQMMKDVAPHAPYIVAGTTKPSNSPAQNWYQNLGTNTVGGPNAFNLATEFAAAKSKQQSILGNPSAVGMLAANQTPYFDFLQKHSLTKGIL
jgi:peptide deformylase